MVYAYFDDGGPESKDYDSNYFFIDPKTHFDSNECSGEAELRAELCNIIQSHKEYEIMFAPDAKGIISIGAILGKLKSLFENLFFSAMAKL